MPVPLFASCWLWTGARSGDGYGMKRVAGRTVYTHRYIYELFVGPIPRGLEIDHLCRQRGCCNPLHLRPSTRRENYFAAGSKTKGMKTHCPAGHHYSTENTIRDKYTAYRKCRCCHNTRRRVTSQQKGL